MADVNFREIIKLPKYLNLHAMGDAIGPEELFAIYKVYSYSTFIDLSFPI